MHAARQGVSQLAGGVRQYCRTEQCGHGASSNLNSGHYAVRDSMPASITNTEQLANTGASRRPPPRRRSLGSRRSRAWRARSCWKCPPPPTGPKSSKSVTQFFAGIAPCGKFPVHIGSTAMACRRTSRVTMPVSSTWAISIACMTPQQLCAQPLSRWRRRRVAERKSFVLSRGIADRVSTGGPPGHCYRPRSPTTPEPFTRR